MSQRIWGKNKNFEHCFILKIVKFVGTHMAKKCHKFPTLFHKVGEICRNAYGEKMQ